MEQLNAKSIFGKALEIEEAEKRAAYLDQVCGVNHDIKNEVEALLRAFSEAGDFLSPINDKVETAAIPSLREGPGALIGPYKLLQQIGEGGMGVVYMAEQTKPIHRKVALKVIKAGMDSRQVIARFDAERQALAMMDHINIARVLDAGTTEAGRPYFVMELVNGVPITKYCDDNHLTPRERLELFVPVCQAIQHAHQKGIIHRDIKPSNVMVTLYDGKPVPKVIDFGVAKATEQKLTECTLFTQYGSMVGTLEYMSPEQAELSALGVDTRSDIYSLGVLLYELMTGSTPLTHKRMKEAVYADILRMIKEEEPPKPSTRLIDSGEALASISAQRKMEPAKLSKLMRGELDWIVMKTLEKDRNRRYETANGLAQDIDHYLTDEAVQACPPSTLYRFRKFARRNKLSLTTALGIALLVLFAAVGLAISNMRIGQEKAKKEQALQQAEVNEATANTQRAIAQNNEQMAEAEKKRAVKQEGIAKEQGLLARRRFYAAQMNLAMQAWEAGQATRVLALLESQRPKIDEEDLRSFEWYYMWRLCQGGYRIRLPMVNYDNASVMAISPDGKTLATGFEETVKLWDALTGQEKGALMGHRGLVRWLAFTPDGKRLISAGAKTIHDWDLVTGKELRTLTPGPGSASARFAVAGDSNTLILGGATVTLWDLTTGRQVSVVTSGGSDSFDFIPAISADGQTVAAYRLHGTIVKVWARDGDSWREQPSINGHGRHSTGGTALAFSPDGKLLAIAGDILKCYDSSTGQARLTLSGHSGNVLAVTFSADGKVLASGGHDQSARLWDAATGRALGSLAHPAMVHGVVLSADGKVVATAGGGVCLWDATPQESAITLAHKAAVSAVALSPDGKTLASAGLDGTKLWQLAERRVITTLPGPPNQPEGKLSLTFSPDGKTLATGHQGGTIAIWSTTGEQQGVLEGHGHAGPLWSLAFSPDGKSLASAGGDSRALLWDFSTRKLRVSISLPGWYMGAVAFSPDGKRLAVGSQFGVVKLYEAATGRETATLRRFEFAPTFTAALAFSPDSTLLAASDREGFIQIWEASTGRLQASLKGHVGTVWSVSFAPDGRTVATASADHTVRLWDVATGQERCTLKGHQGPVNAVEFMPDGNTLITGSADGTVRLWPAAIDARARARKEELEPNVDGTPAAANELGDALWQYGRTAEAEDAYGKALARLEELATTFSDSPGLRQEMIRTLLSQSLLLEQSKRPAEAASACKRAREIYRNLSSNEQQALIWACSERSRKLASIGNDRQAERTYRQAVELSVARFEKLVVAFPREPEYRIQLAHSNNKLAWILATCPDLKLRDPKRAVEFAEKAVELTPKEGIYWNTLGVVHYRTGDWKAALAALEMSMELRNGGDAINWFFLAMAHWQLDQKEQARKWYDQAVQWMDKNKPKDEKLIRFRAEATALLGIDKKKD